MIKYLFDIYPNNFEFSVSTTTRNPRQGEVNGKDYHFVDRDTFIDMIHNDEFYETTDVHGNLYGTTKKAVHDIINSGKIFITDVHVTAAIKLKENGLDFNCLCILPSSQE
jgi:guanylate kinase